MSKAFALAGSTGPDGSNAQAVHALGEVAQGVNVGFIAHQNTRITHEAFRDSNGISHAFNYDSSGSGIVPLNHDTWMAGIVASRGGASHPNDIGVAPGADIHTARVVDNNSSIHGSWLEDALEELVVNRNCRVIMTGIALDPMAVAPDGQSQWARMYDYYAYHHNVVFANAAANTPTQILVFGDVFNGITTAGLILTDPDVYGRVGSLSGAGPTDDNRRKPEVAAPSQNQTMPSAGSDTSWYTTTSGSGATSFSVPHTAGVAALMVALANKTPDPNNNQNEVIKAVIVNSTFGNINDRDNNPTNPADPNNTWHAQRGYGRINALRAYELLGVPEIRPDSNTVQLKGWAYGTITEAYEQHSWFVNGSKNHRMVATVTWNRLIDHNGSEYIEEPQPKFSLDLTIIDPNGRTLFAETDTINNLKKADIILPGNSIYQISLESTTPGNNRSYGFAFELLAPIPGDFHGPNYIVDFQDLSVLAREWLLEEPNLEMDLTGDSVIDMFDLSEFASHWLETDPAYYQPQ